MKDIKYIIFDFDGTIADSFKFGVKISNKLALRFDYKLITQDKIEYYRGRTTQEILKEAKIPFYKFPFVVKEFRKEINKIIEQLKPFADMPEVIRTLSKKYKLGVLSSNSQSNVETVLKTNNLLTYFEFIKSKSKLLSKSKSMKKLLLEYNLKPENIIYIGDETRDIEAAHKVNIKIICVSWGFNTRKVLSKYSPDYLVDQPLEILKII